MHLLHWQVDSLLRVPPGKPNNNNTNINNVDIPGVSEVENPPAMQVQSPGGGDPLEKEMQPTPPRESHGQRGLVVYILWDCKESDMI